MIVLHCTPKNKTEYSGVHTDKNKQLNKYINCGEGTNDPYKTISNNNS